MIALMDLAPKQVGQLFGDLRQQLRSHFDDSPVTIPFDGVDPEEIVIYEKELYVQPDPVGVGQTLRNEFETLLVDSREETSETNLQGAFEQLLSERSLTEGL